jgi:hypothetical protein
MASTLEDKRAEKKKRVPPRRVVRIFERDFRMPQSKVLRVSIGIGLVMLGILGFLPILGFWMIPLGLLVLSYEFAAIRRMRRRGVVWWERRRR